MKPIASMSEASSEMAESEKSSVFTPTRSVLYERGAIFSLRASDLENRLLTVRVLRVYRPFSFSCTMTVEILHGLSESDNIPQRAVLKMYDRRFAQDLRLEHKLEAWTQAHENAFVDFVGSGEATRFMSSLHQSSDYLEEPESGWNLAESEAYLQSWCSDMRASELEVYQHLNDLQGTQIPRIFTAVTTCMQAPQTGPSATARESAELLQTPGFLMEHIVGHTLVQMPDFIHPKQWQTIFDKALDVIRVISDKGVLNEKISAANFVASPQSSGDGGYRVAMVDFAQCTIRQHGESDGDWQRRSAGQDEEVNFGRAMTIILNRVGFSLRYSPPTR